MLKTEFKTGKISPYQLFSALFVSRIIVTLTYIQNVSVGNLSSDLLISVFLGLIGSLILCIPVCFCLKNKIMPLEKKAICVFYTIFFVINISIGLIRFSYFATSRFNTPLPMVAYLIIILMASCYTCTLGLEPLGRFSSFCSVLLLLATAIVIVFNIDDADIINLYPVIVNEKSDVFENAIMIATNTIEPAIALVVCKNVNGSKVKPLIFSIVSAFSVIFVLIFMCMAVMGSGASLQSYPIFTLFQMASVGSVSRFDMIHTGFWMLALLLKTSLLIFVASKSIGCFKIKYKPVIVSMISFVLSMILIYAFKEKSTEFVKCISMVTSIIFVTIFPLASFFVKRRRKKIEKI